MTNRFIERNYLTGFTPRLHVVVGGSLLLGVAALALLFWLYKDVNVWESWTAARGLKYPSYQERIYENSIFRTRTNTWSNYAYIMVGAYILGLAWTDCRGPRREGAGYLVRQPIFSVLFGLGCIHLGIGSALLHASLTRFGQQFDVGSMYTAMLVLIAMNFSRLFVGRGALHTTAIWVSVAGVVAASIYLFVYKWEMSARNVLATLILTIFVLSALDIFRKDSFFIKSWLLAASISLVLAIVARQTGVAGTWIFPGPDTWLQGHTFWHLLTAVTLGCTYMYFRSERQILTALRADEHDVSSKQTIESL